MDALEQLEKHLIDSGAKLMTDTVEPEPVNPEPKQEINQEPKEEPKQIEPSIPDSIDNNGSSNNESLEVLKMFASGIGYDEPLDNIGDVTINTLTEIAKKKIEAINAQVAQYDRPEIVSLKEHLDNGYSIDSFLKVNSIVNNFENVTIGDDDIETAEQISSLYLKQKGLDDDFIEMSITNLKDSGKIIETSKSNLEALKKEEETHNAKVREDILNQEKAALDEAKSFYTNINAALETNNFDGFKLAPAEIEELKKVSLPNAEGVVELNEIIDTLTPDKIALLNYCVLKISKGLPFNIVFNKNIKDIGSKPIVSLLSSQQQRDNSEFIGIDELRNLMNNQ